MQYLDLQVTAEGYLIRDDGWDRTENEYGQDLETMKQMLRLRNVQYTITEEQAGVLL